MEMRFLEIYHSCLTHLPFIIISDKSHAWPTLRCLSVSVAFARHLSISFPYTILPESMILHIFTFNFKRISYYTNRFTLESSIRLEFYQPCARVLNTSRLDFKWVSKSFVNYIHRWLLKSSWLVSGEGEKACIQLAKNKTQLDIWMGAVIACNDA